MIKLSLLSVLELRSRPALWLVNMGPARSRHYQAQHDPRALYTCPRRDPRQSPQRPNTSHGLACRHARRRGQERGPDRSPRRSTAGSIAARLRHRRQRCGSTSTHGRSSEGKNTAEILDGSVWFQGLGKSVFARSLRLILPRLHGRMQPSSPVVKAARRAVGRALQRHRNVARRTRETRRRHSPR